MFLAEATIQKHIFHIFWIRVVSREKILQLGSLDGTKFVGYIRDGTRA